MSEGRNEQNFPQNLSQPIVYKAVLKFHVQMCVCVCVCMTCESKIALPVGLNTDHMYSV